MCVFTTGFDVEKNVLVIMQVVMEDETHGELRKDKTQLMRRTEKKVYFPKAINNIFSDLVHHLHTHVEDDVED